MKKVAKFEKISLEQFKKDWGFGGNVEEIYEQIKLPVRATRFSAGYDFFAPQDIVLAPNQSIIIPTGIRCQIEENYVLQIFPRSGLGFKFRLQLDNTVGIIDADYYNALNEGHIMIKITNLSLEGKVVEVKQGQGLLKGCFWSMGLRWMMGRER